jgi:transcription elongation factor GreA
MDLSPPGDGAVAPWPELRPPGTLSAIPKREEFEVSALSAVTADEDLLVTAHGYERLCVELESLRTVQRAALSEQLRQARADGDSDNRALFDLLEEQAQLERRISVLEAQVAAARVAAPPTNGRAGIGSCVRVRHRSGDVAEYHLVSSIESDLGNGRVSIAAPVGRALVGRRSGETVLVETPKGRQELAILAVSPAGTRTKKAA